MRLTERLNNGAADFNCSCCKYSELIDDKWFCSSGESCFTKIVDKLCELEDALDNDTLIRVPFKIGSNLYWTRYLGNSKWKVEPVYLRSIHIDIDGIMLEFVYEGNHTQWTNTKQHELYATREEAEKCLKELQNGDKT